MILNFFKVLVPTSMAFAIGIAITPIITHYLYKYKMWKKKARNEALGGGETPIFNKLHKEKEVNTPRMGGLVISISVLITTLFFWLVALILADDLSLKMNFLSRSQTWLPFSILIISSIVGFIDDYLVVSGKGGYIAGGLPLKVRVGYVALVGLIAGWWFFNKLGVSSITLPFDGDLSLGIFFIPIFIIIMVGIFSGGVIDGIDGLSGGVFTAIFSAYGVIALIQHQIDLSAFCFVIAGALLAFLWFNIPPARFYMSETGILALTTSLVVVAFLTRQVIVLPIIAFPLVATSASVIIQYFSKKIRGKKVFLVAPVHHHFEALGWPNYKVAMRYWILSVMFAIFGMVIAIIG